MQVLHNVRFFSSVATDQKIQKKLITEYVNTFFRWVNHCRSYLCNVLKFCRKNAIKGRARDPPMSYKDAMDMVNNVLAKNGISHLSNLCAMDPYLTRHQQLEKMKRLEEKASSS